MREPCEEPNDSDRVIKDVLEVLSHKGSKSLEMAKESVLREKIQSKKAREALAYYVENFLEFTPPAFLALACEAVGGKTENTTLIGAAIALFVGAIDIHDDIIDQSEVKDGRQTVFGSYGKEVALLTGDALLIKGFALFQTATRIFQPERMVRIAETIQEAFFEMGDAHALETNLMGRLDVTPEEYLQLVKKKAASVEAYTKIGAIIGNGTLDEIEMLAKYGRIWGMLSTIRNDFVDLYERDELQNRKLNEILPLPILCSFRDPQAKSETLKILSKERITELDLENIINMVLETKQVKKLKKLMETWVHEAQDCLGRLRRSRPKSILEKFISAMLEDL